MDALSSALSELRALRGRFHASRLVGDWGLRFPRSEGCVVHLLRGPPARSWVSGEVVTLEDGELLVLPHGDAHAIGQRPDGLEVAFPDRASVRRDWSRGERPATDLVCAEVVLREDGTLPLLAALPKVLRVPASPPVDGVVALLADQADREGPGSFALVTRLVEVLVIQAVRAWAERAEEAPAWVRGARDPVVGRALAAVQARPDRPWTVATMARTAGTSRSRFAERFTALLGTTPMRWVQAVRLRRAADDLARGDRVAEVARRWGYASAAAFSRAYKQQTGSSPRSARRTDRPAVGDGT